MTWNERSAHIPFQLLLYRFDKLGLFFSLLGKVFIKHFSFNFNFSIFTGGLKLERTLGYCTSWFQFRLFFAHLWMSFIVFNSKPELLLDAFYCLFSVVWISLWAFFFFLFIQQKPDNLLVSMKV